MVKSVVAGDSSKSVGTAQIVVSLLNTIGQVAPSPSLNTSSQNTPLETSNNIMAVTESSGPKESRGVGCLLGQYIGDALGTRYEFTSGPTAAAKVAQDMVNGSLPILGGGPFSLKAGQVTDDTELAMGLATTLLNGKYNRAAAAGAYKGWLDSDPFDVGNATRNAFKIAGPVTENVTEVMLEQAKARNAESLSNGCLMRTSPLAIAGANWSDAELVKAAKADCELSNPHPDAKTATAAYVIALKTLITTGGDMQRAFAYAKETAKESQLVTQLLTAAEKGQVQVALPGGGPAAADSAHQGYFGVALQWAFDQLLHAPSFEKGLIEVVTRGGDTDTNGCIAGALLGARFGAEAIPETWKNTVTAAEQKRIQTYPCVDSRKIAETAVRLMRSQHTGSHENEESKAADHMPAERTSGRAN